MRNRIAMEDSGLVDTTDLRFRMETQIYFPGDGIAPHDDGEFIGPNETITIHGKGLYVGGFTLGAGEELADAPDPEAIDAQWDHLLAEEGAQFELTEPGTRVWHRNGEIEGLDPTQHLVIPVGSPLRISLVMCYNR